MKLAGLVCSLKLQVNEDFWGPKWALQAADG